MKKNFGFLLILALIIAVSGQSVQATVLTGGLNKLFFNDYETVFRNDGAGNYDELNQTSGPVNLAVGDVFVGIINLQEITDANNITVWDNPNGDQLTGIFAQEITNISSGGSGIIVDLAPTSVTTFNPVVGSSFNTGLAANEMFEIYLDAGGSSPFTIGGTIADSIAAATNGVSWMTLGDADSPSTAYTTFNETDNNTALGNPVAGEEYAWSDVTPFGTPLIDFAGQAFLGLSVLDYISDPSLIGVPLLNDPTEVRFNTDVEFYANSQLTINPDFVGLAGGGTSNWVFESNDPARVGAAIPEPGTVFLLGLGMLGISYLGRRRKRS